MADKQFILYFTLRHRYDGDTMEGVIDYGGDLKQLARIRLYDCDTPEARGPHRVFGLYVRDYCDLIMPAGLTYQIVSEAFDRDNFARFLCNIVGSKDETLSRHLINLRMAISYYDKSGNPKPKKQRIKEHQENYRYHIEQGNIIEPPGG